jgi:hypothetical protein
MLLFRFLSLHSTGIDCCQIHRPAIKQVMKRDDPQTFTIWNAPASARVPALDQLDLEAPATWTAEDKQQVAEARARADAKYGRAFAPSRSISDALRKILK